MNRQSFERKLNALQDLADRGKLIKTDVIRDKTILREYRSNIMTQAKKQWGNDPQRVENIRALLRNLDADHLHELQLGGLDQLSSLSLLDKQVNRSIGAQVQQQIKDLSVGTKITSVVEKGVK